MRAPVATDRCVILIRSGRDMIILASLSFPIAPDFDVFGATAIPLTGLI
jgi:hypothetical protein